MHTCFSRFGSAVFALREQVRGTHAHIQYWGGVENTRYKYNRVPVMCGLDARKPVVYKKSATHQSQFSPLPNSAAAYMFNCGVGASMFLSLNNNGCYKYIVQEQG